MRIIVCNIGSTSFKFQLLEMDSEAELARGSAERVGSSSALVTYRAGEKAVLSSPVKLPSQKEAVRHALDFLTRASSALLRDVQDLAGVGFKCVQAGERNGTVLLTDDVLAAMEDYADLAPAHNPPYLEAIRMFRDLLPGKPLVGVFEPGFHRQAPDYARIYGTPYDWIEQYGVRRYGYHGASHQFVTEETVRVLGLPAQQHRLISCHLGGSSSVCAVKDGAAIDTSMGFTPQSGLIQGNRVGDMDPFVLPYIMKRKQISLEEALRECSQEAGLAGLSGTSGDMRDINQQISQGSPRARLARDKFIYDVRRYIGSYLILLEGLDALTFTGGIGQRDANLRSEVLGSLQFLGLKLDEEANRNHARLISAADSRIKALVIATNEEIVVARETARLIRAQTP